MELCLVIQLLRLQESAQPCPQRREGRKKALRRWDRDRDRDVGSLSVTGQFIVFIVSSHLLQIRFAKGALLLNLQEYLISQSLW